MDIKLGVNIDHVATLRQARGIREPDPVTAGLLAELGGADQITVHLREDRRHIQDADLWRLKDTVKVPLNLEMALSDEIMGIALKLKPARVTLVPEKRRELTTEGGLDVISNRDAIKRAGDRLHRAGIALSLFIDPSLNQVEAGAMLKADAVELHTGSYCGANHPRESEDRLNDILRSAGHARGCGLEVYAGHGLNLRNVEPIAAIPEIVELNIGHSIVGHAILVGMERAVREMKDKMIRARQ